MTRSRRQRFRPIIEGLDDRCLLSALTPGQVASVYGLSGLSFGTQAANGSGQTIAIIDAYNDPNIRAELSAFDSANNLPDPPSLTVVGQSGTSALPATDAGWAQEEALDVEWAHALAPGARIVLVEANSESMTDLLAAVKTATGVPGVSVVSMSWGGSEGRNVISADSAFTAPGVTFVAATGDNGSFSGAQWPASSPNVVAVGGTTLQVGAGGTYLGETAWSGSGGGLSRVEPEPSYQDTVQSTGRRSTPDVAFDADPNTGVQVYSIDPSSGQGSWLTVGGTSLGAPAWAALIAIADQGRTLANEGTLGSTQTLTALYSLPSSDFHTIGGGYNTQTGLGTPNGAALINDLVSSGESTLVTTPPVSTTPVSTTPTTTPPVSTTPVTTPPVSTTPVSTTPVSTTPVSITPVSTTPVSTTPVTTPPVSTPTPADPPVSSTPVKIRARRGHLPVHIRVLKRHARHTIVRHKSVRPIV